MLRRASLAFAAALLSLLVLPAVPAAAGGGCHDGVTTGSGTKVDLLGACFTPTTLRIEPGETVTFTNQDPMVHNVTANAWGHFDDLNPGEAFRATFDDAGVYPYACTYHPGMTGAIVVGNGTGAGNGDVVEALGASSPSPSPEVVTVRASATQADDGSSAAAWLGGAAIGIAIGAFGMFVLRRRPRGSGSTA